MRFQHGRLQIAIFNDPMFYENGMLLWLEGGEDCWIIDPGLPPQPEQMAQAIERLGLTRRAIVLTHAHPDHIAGVTPLRERLKEEIPVLCPVDEVELLTSAESNLSALMGTPIVGPAPDQTVQAGETLSLGPLSWQTLDVAGHSPGALAFYCAEAGAAIVGDALFAEGIGRYDFPHSDRERLLRNIEENLLSLPDSTMIYPGHGERATIGQIKVGNMTLMGELSR